MPRGVRRYLMRCLGIVVILMKPLRARRLRYRLVRPSATPSFLANERCVTAAFCSTSLRSWRSRWDWISIRTLDPGKSVQELNTSSHTCQGKTQQAEVLGLKGDLCQLFPEVLD